MISPKKYVFFELKDVLSPVHCTCNKPGPGNEVLVLSNVFWCEVTSLSVVSAIVNSLQTKYAEFLVQKIIWRNMKTLFLLFASSKDKIHRNSWK